MKARGEDPAEKHRYLLFGAAAVLRLLLFLLFPTWADLLAGRVELSTPVTGFKRLQEGVFLYNRGISPYDGGIYHQAPLLLPVFSLLPSYKTAAVWTNAVYVLTDLLTADAIWRIAKNQDYGNKNFQSTRIAWRWSNLAITGAFLFNPFTVATCLARPTTIFTDCAIAQAVASALEGKIFNSILALASASYLSLYPVLLLPPLALLAHHRYAREHADTTSSTFIGVYSAGFLGATCGLLLLSYFVMGFSWEFLSSTYGTQLLLTDLTPNVGLWWYFFIEMFDSFREFFLSVFWLHMGSYTGGLTLKFRQQPLFVIVTLCGIFTMFKPYPSVSDVSLYFGLFPLYSHILPLLRYSFIATAALLYASFLGPAFYHSWIYAGSGNANFFYAITLVWNLALTLLVADTIYSVLKDELEVERPELKGKAVRQI